MCFIFKIRLILIYILFLYSSFLFADVDKDFLIEKMKDTWKIQDQSLLENWSQYEINEYTTSTLETTNIDKRSRLDWNEKDQILTISYFNRYFKDRIGYIRIYLNETKSDDYKKKLNSDRRIDSVVINGVRFNFTQYSDVVEVFLGDLSYNDIDRIEDRLRVAVNSNEIFNPWLRINNEDLKKEFNDNPEYGYYLSKPQQAVLNFLTKIYEQNRLNEGVLVQLPTGMGKTRSIFSFIKDIEKKNNSNTDFSHNDRSYRVLWFVSGIDILRQTTLDFNANFSKDSMFSLYAETNNEDNRKILNNYNDLSVSLDSLVRDSSEKDQESNVNLDLVENWINSSNKPVIIVVDEAHRSSASKYLEAIERIRKDCSDKISALIGMTATPYRSDLDLPSADFYGSWFIWEVDDNSRKITTAKDQILSASEQGYIPLISFRSLRKGSLSDETKKNSYDRKKLEKYILTFLQDLSTTNNKILIYHARGKSRDGRSTNKQAEFMEFLQDNKDQLNIKVYSINAIAKEDEDGNNTLDEFRRENRAILNLTMVGDYGVDIPDVDCIVFLDESDSQVKTVQRIGRSFRLSGNKPIVSIYDLGNGRILENLGKKIFYNEDPRKIEERVKITREEVDVLKTISDSVDVIEQQYNGFITEIHINSTNVEDIRTSLFDISNLCEKLENILDQKEELTDKEILLKNIIEKIINQNDGINEFLLQELKELLDGIIYMSVSELVEQLVNFDINDKELLKSSIIEMVEFWVRKNKKYPQQNDYGTNFPDQVGVSRDKIKRVFGNYENPSGIEVLKEKILDSDKRYVDAILQTMFDTTYWYKNQRRREKLQGICIEIVFDFIDENGRFPTRDDFEKRLVRNISYIKVYGDKKYKGIFDSSDDFIMKILEYLESANIEEIYNGKKDKYLDAIYKSSSIRFVTNEQILQKCREYIRKKIEDENKFLGEYLFSKLYEGDEGELFRTYIQKSFIKIILLPFIDKNERFPSVGDFNMGILGNLSWEQVYVSRKSKKGIFNNTEDFIVEVLKYLDELENIKEIDKTEKDKYLGVIYKSDVIRLIKDEDKQQILQRCREYIRKKIEYENIFLGEYLFSNLYKGEEGESFREYIQQSFIEIILLPFIDNNKKFPSMDDFKKGLLGSVSKHTVYGQGSYIGIFDSVEDIIIKTLEYIQKTYSIEFHKTEDIKTLVKLRLEIICNKIFRNFKHIRNQKLYQALQSYKIQEMLNEYGCEDILIKINKLLCTSLFSQVNP